MDFRLFAKFKGLLTPQFELLHMHSRQLVHYVCNNFRTDYFIVVDKIVIKLTMTKGNSSQRLRGRLKSGGSDFVGS